MHINVFSIEKNSNKVVDTLNQEYMKMISRYSGIEDKVLFNKKIALAQSKGEKEAKASYSELYTPHLKGFNIFLDEKGKAVDSLVFSKIFDHSTQVNFFIGGAYGFEPEFLKEADMVISLSNLTYAHKIAKLVLYEQIYRGLCIRHNHPYHKV